MKMLALHELRSYKGEERVWVGKYRDLSNLHTGMTTAS